MNDMKNRVLSVTIFCASCGVPFHPWAGRESTSKYCSSRCHGIGITPVYSAEDIEAAFWAKVVKGKTKYDCWGWSGSSQHKIGSRYGLLVINQKKELAHRYSYRLHHGAIPSGMMVCHHCDNPPCTNPLHLFLGTMGDNIQDAVSKNRIRPIPVSRGVDQHLSKLDEGKVKEIRASTGRLADIASRYGVSKSCVCAVRKRQTWRHVT